MISELHINNWKSYTSSKLYIDELTFIVGTNASGKSNLLDALLCLSMLAQGRNINDVVNDIRGGQDWFIRSGMSEASLAVLVSQDMSSTPYKYEVRFAKSHNGIEIAGETLVNTRTNRRLMWTNPVSMGSPTIDARFYTARKGGQKRLDLGRNSSILSQIETLNVIKDIKQAAAVVSLHLSRIFVLNPIPNNMRGYSPLSTVLLSDASNIAGVLAGMDVDTKKNVEQTITRYIRPLPERDIKRVWAETVGLFGKDAMLYCEEEWVNGKVELVDARGMSDGTLRFIAIVAALLTMPENGLLIVEEVDNGLHPSRVKELIAMLRELGHPRRIDILCTTHNPILVNELGPEMLPFISYIKRDELNGGSIVEMLEDKSNLAKLMAQSTIGGLMVEDRL